MFAARPSSAGSRRSSRSRSRSPRSRPQSAGSSRPQSAASNQSMFSQYDNAVIDKRRDLLVKLLQRETMKEAMFKDMQLRNGGGITPTQETDAAARTMAEALVDGNIDVLAALDAQDEEQNGSGSTAVNIQPTQPSVRVPIQPPRLNIAAVQAANQANRSNSNRPPRPQSARSDARRSRNGGSRSRSNSPRPSSAGSQSARDNNKKNWSPMAEAIAKLYERTQHLRQNNGTRSPRPQSAGSIRKSRPGSSTKKNTTSTKNVAAAIVQEKETTKVEPKQIQPPTYQPGQEVKARSHSRQDYRTARVIAKNNDGTYDLRYEFAKPAASVSSLNQNRDANSHIPRKYFKANEESVHRVYGKHCS